MSEDLRIAQLLDDMFDSQLSPEEACRDHPELLEEVRIQWRRMSALQAKLETRFPPASSLVGKESQTPGPFVGLPQIDGYEVEGVLGKGGMGVVYKAHHLKLNRTVAIKMLLSGAYAGAQELARFHGEAKAVAGLRHNNIVQVHDVGDVEGQPYYTMEFLEGGTLAKMIAGQPVPASQACDVVAALAEAMQVAHRKGIIHRDLKPANILLTAEGTPKISDFGLARRFEVDEHLTLSGARIGTLSYMAPEQALGRSDSIAPAVDIYSLGAVLYEMITGRPPFRGVTAQETERQLLTEEPVSPRRLNSSVPRDLETICLKCLRKNSRRRYESAEDLASDLHRFQRGEPITARPISAAERTARWVRRNITLVAALSLGLLLLFTALGGAAWFISDRQTARQSIEIDLQEAVSHQRSSRWSEARAALERARARYGDRYFPELRALLQRADHDQETVARLEAIRWKRAANVYGQIDASRFSADYEAAFHELGIAVRSDDPTAVASFIQQSNIKTVLISAVEDWAANTDDPSQLNWLLQVAREAAPDPAGWREKILSSVVWSNQKELAKLIDSAPVTENSVPLLLTLGERFVRRGGNPVELFKRCQRVRSNDYWVNFWLAQALRLNGNPLESLRYYQAALAVRPDSSAVYTQLGNALHTLGRYDEAIDAYSAGLQLNPESSADVLNLGILLSQQGRHAEAIPMLHRAIGFLPKDANLHFSLGSSLTAIGQREEGSRMINRGVELDPNFLPERPGMRTLLLRYGTAAEDVRKLWRTALANNPPKHESWDGYAELSLFLGQEDEYRWARQELLKRFTATNDPYIAERTGRACLLLPGTGEEHEKSAVLVGKAITADPTTIAYWAPYYFSFAKGLLEYRRGHFREAAVIMKREAAQVLGPAPGLVLAMSEFRLGQKEEAQKTFVKAVQSFNWTPAKAENREEWMYHVLRREAEALFRQGAATSKH